ncbi:MAG: TolC family protein [Gemmatimonadetes bacterium]|nr:TolC family protein [Gemmatimonadota bacterium]NNM04178.1 TolC family protein [Gemmatimonadota bacterium]
MESTNLPKPSATGFRCSLLSTGWVMLAGAVALLPLSVPVSGQVGPQAEDQPQVVELTMENMVALTMASSFRVRRLNYDIERERLDLKAEEAGLKSSVNLELVTPSFRLTSEPKWNSTIQRNEIIQEHTRRWEGELSIRQPVILFGWPTNGYLSINSRVYQYTQFEDDGSHDTDYYNRYYISYSQPLFQPNGLKNRLESAELDLESTLIEYNGDILRIVSGVSEVYHDLLEEDYLGKVRQTLVSQLERTLATGEALARSDSTRVVEIDQIQVELANARERLRSQESSIRLEFAEVKQELGLNDTDSIAFVPTFQLDPVPIDMEEAVRFAFDLTPTLRQFDIGLRRQEMGLEWTKSRGALRIDLNMSYGRERRDEYFRNLWQDPENSYTINVTASLPLWDWGERKARVSAAEIGIEQTRLFLEETELRIVSDVRNEVLNVRDREGRTMAMLNNLELAGNVSEANLQRYEAGEITAQEVILSLLREADTGENFIETYVNWKESLRRLQVQTYYNFEQDRPFLDVLREEGWVPENGIGGVRP